MVNQLLEPVSFYLKTLDDTFTMHYHTHSYFEFMYAVKGSFTFEYIDNNNQFQKTEVQENEIIFISSLFRHRICVTKGTKSLIANIEYSFTNNSFSPVQRIMDYSTYFNDILLKEMKNNVGFTIINDQSLIKTYMISIIDILKVQYISTDSNLALNTLNFFYNLSQSLKKKKEGSYSFIRNSIEYINENFSKNITVKQLADRVHMNPSYFAHKFKEDRGIPVLKYINTIRVNKACYLLNRTNFSIESIAKLVGYKDNDELNYQFKIIMKSTPKKYKQNSYYEQIQDTALINYHSNDLK